MGNGQNVYLTSTIVDPIDHAPVAQAVAQSPGELGRQPIDVIVAARVVLKLPKTSRQFTGKGRIGREKKARASERED
jgi:hypothetical protein